MQNGDLLAELRARISEIESNSDVVISEDMHSGSGDDGIASECLGAFPVDSKAQTKNRKKGNSPSDSELDATAALKKIVALVNVSDHSEQSIRKRLQRAGFDEAAIDESVTKALDYGFIDDKRYADVLIRSRLSQGRGSIGIERELREQGIDPNSVAGWPFDYAVDSDDELERALSLLERKPPRSKNLRDGAYRKLMQKGFPSSVASNAARMWVERQEYR